MIERVYLKEYVTFDEVELEFNEVELEFSKGLIVFTGPSGAGKSVLMRGILSIFGFFDVNAKISEAIIDNKLDLSDYGIETDDEIIFKQIKKNKSRYFINNQAVSKKIVKEIAKKFIDYLSLREINEFQSENIIKVLDKIVAEKDYYVKLEEYKKLFEEYKKLKKKLEEIEQNEKNAKERIEFLKFELSKIEEINPKPDEFDELMKIKKDLSKIEKIKEKAYEVERIFEFENSVYEFLDMIEEDSEFFSNAMNELRIAIDKAHEKAEFLENVDIEEVLERLSNLQELIRRFGSIEEALRYYEEKKEELSLLENLTFEKTNLQKELQQIDTKLHEIADYLHEKRKKAAEIFEKKLNSYLKKLYMPSAEVNVKKEALNPLGADIAEIVVNDIDINTISTGEFNRLRVALLAGKLEYSDEEKTLFLDEIDANLSGEESMSVAEVLKLLSKKYQIFAISHQPQLASIANKHFLVTKNENKSFVKELNENERIEEIARIIGGKEKSQKAIEYAKELLKAGNG
ncbi:ATPase [Caminibacter pacificus]|uniref:DNA repair protein RecN n=1 Tax=Caminibacter pacificus TaxID=1424653 RepID=A0AAJ4UYI5_9BACT|nr:ATPase [Caminibacter pacificus]NPA88558.1 ATPase [Campylobacterota bacterium]QCI28300.1 ATPase [Caminibacter pacificus]ROR40986.1 DNA repair protein RecN (Recombination protein N) [Caminibacter pacificus]